MTTTPTGNQAIPEHQPCPRDAQAKVPTAARHPASTITLDDGQELETILHHRAGKPLSGDCTCPQAYAGAFCTHLVWVGLSHLGLNAPPGAALNAETAPASELRPWLATLHQDQLIELIIEVAGTDRDYRRQLFLQARQSNHQ